MLALNVTIKNLNLVLRPNLISNLYKQKLLQKVLNISYYYSNLTSETYFHICFVTDLKKSGHSNIPRLFTGSLSNTSP